MAFGTVKKLVKVFRAFKYGSIKDNLSLLKYTFDKNKYVTLKLPGNKKWAYISYLPESLLRFDPLFLNFHQNRREMKVIAECFLKNGYNIVIQDYRVKAPIPDYKYDVIFGLEPNFTICSLRHPNAIKIYYGTGAYFKYANSEVIRRTQEFNSKYHIEIPPRRLAPIDDCIEICDRILQIGSTNTIDTYPPYIRPKISIINQSSNFLLSSSTLTSERNPKKFLWLGSSGSILKGADLTIEVFLNHPELEIDFVGPVEQEVKDVFGPRLRDAKNIRFHGFVDVNSQKFLDIVKDTTFLIFPSVTEGAPGSVIVAMKLGIIPIVSKVASPDDIKELGYSLSNVSMESIERALIWSQNLSKDDIKQLSSACKVYSNLFTLENFRDELNSFLNHFCI